jgi:hypothetical protein
LDDLQNGYTYYQLQNSFVWYYNRSKRTHNQALSEKAAKIIEENLLTPKGVPRWEDFNAVADRLNSPELLDYYIDTNITYDHKIPRYHRSPRSVLKSRYGDCDDLAYFGRFVLTKAGYDVFGRIVGNKPCHIGLGVKLEDGSYLLAVSFSNTNYMSGPHKTMLELDKRLGYGGIGYEKIRGPFHFDWR